MFIDIPNLVIGCRGPAEPFCFGCLEFGSGGWEGNGAGDGI